MKHNQDINGFGKYALAFAIAATALGMAAPVAAQDIALKKYKIDSDHISVSGISSGGALTVQLHIAYSSIFKRGVGIVAAPPYFCGEGDMMTALSNCVQPSDDKKINTAAFIEKAKAWSGQSIDDVGNLADSKVYIFSGAKDATIKGAVVAENRAFYSNFTAEKNIVYKNDIPAAHAMVVDTGKVACDAFEEPYINNCNFDLPGTMLKWIHGDLKPRVPSIPANLIKFSQDEFRGKTRDSDAFDSTAWAYVPGACKSGEECKLHIALHGCQQGQGFVGDKYVRNAGYNEWAEANNIVVLYPQVGPSGQLGTPTQNPLGCWDWWGYSGTDYALRNGAQVSAIKKMIDRLTDAK